MDVSLRDGHLALDSWYADLYESCWCSSLRPHLLVFLDTVFTTHIPRALAMRKGSDSNDEVAVWDVGCGPSVCNVLSAGRLSSHIVMSDLLTSNLESIKKFVEEQKCNDALIRTADFVAGLENAASADRVSASDILERTRKAIVRVSKCDLTDINLDMEKKFDVIIASLVLDVVAISPSDFTLTLFKLKRQLRSQGGFILIHGSLNETHYCIGSACLPVMTVRNEDHLVNLVQAVDGLKVRLCSVECEHATPHYSALIEYECH